MKSLLWSTYITSLLLVAGCSFRAQPKEESPEIWEQTKLGELAPVGGFPGREVTPLVTTNLTAHIYDIPADKLPQLSSLWQNLELQGIRFRNHQAFRSNAFRIGRADLEKWEWIQMSLGQIGAIKVSSCTLMLSDQEDTDLRIRPIPQRHNLHFTNSKQEAQQADIGPGYLVLRMRDDRNYTLDQVCRLTAYPTFALESLPASPELAQHVKKQEVAFMAAGFKLNLRPNDLFVLGPEDYYGDQSTLGGLFFINESGNLFSQPGPHRSSQRKQAVRLMVVVCNAIHLNEPML